MTTNRLEILADLIKHERPVLLARWRQQMRRIPSARHLEPQELNDHVPLLLDEFVETLSLKADATNPVAMDDGSSPAHGLQRLQDEFDIEEIVEEYNILRACIHDLADENDLSLQGEPFRAINSFFDHSIGSAVQAYATQRSLEVKLRRDEYLAFVAHDLRTPLSAVSLAAMVLELKLAKEISSVETAPIFKALRRNVEHLQKLIGKVLDENTNLETETGIKLERRELDLWPLLEAVIQDLRPVAETAGTQLINHVPVDLVAYADAGLLRRVFQNLIANAIKYTPQGEVMIEAHDLSPEGAVECLIRDNGAGIADELLEKVFDKGETDQVNKGGLGLGLAIVKTFVEAHDGKVSVESKLGVGSTFKFSLPNKATASA